MSLNTELKQLESEFKKKSKEQFKLRDKIEALLLKRDLPKLKKKYEGKYFVYDNGYNNEDRWPVYSFCIQVTGFDDAIGNSFQTDTYGKSEFTVKSRINLFLFQKQITEKQYNRALANFKRKFNQL